jgi:hypothetical protein
VYYHRYLHFHPIRWFVTVIVLYS